MTRHIEHGQLRKRKCKCGATFKKDGDLRRHLADVQGEERVVWINTAVPQRPRSVRKH